jgi:hypothetical protein
MSSSVITAAPESTVRVFVSYAREDRRWLEPDDRFNLVPFLAESLRRQNVVFWFDKELQPGDEFKRQIESEIDHSQIALLIVSQSFLNSEFIEGREMPRIAARAAQGKMIVMPVLVEPCAWNDYPFLADRQMVPSASPLIDFTESEPKWARVRYQILDGIKAQLKRIRGAQAATAFAETAAAVPGAGESPGGLGAAADSAQSVASISGGAAPSRKIPAWAWSTGAVAVLLLVVLLVASLPRTHPHPAASPAPRPPAMRPAASNDSSGARTPSPKRTAAQRRVPQQPAGQPGTLTTRPSPPPPPAQAQVRRAAVSSGSGSTAKQLPQQVVAAPAQAAPQPAALSAPKPAQPPMAGAALTEAMKSIQNDLNGIGRVDFAASFRNTGNGNVFQNSYVEEVSSVAADAAQCRVSWHWRVWKNGSTQPMQDRDISFEARGIENVYVEPMQQSLTNVAAAEGRSGFVAISTSPAAVALVVQHTQGINMLPFTDASRAQGTATALSHAAELCRSGVN